MYSGIKWTQRVEIWAMLFLSLAAFLWYSHNQFIYLLASGYQLLQLLGSLFAS